MKIFYMIALTTISHIYIVSTLFKYMHCNKSNSFWGSGNKLKCFPLSLFVYLAILISNILEVYIYLPHEGSELYNIET